MKHRLSAISLCLLIIVLGLWCMVGQAYAEFAVVHAVLFYSLTCPHCHKVITEDLPPLGEKYEEQLSILALNSSTPQGETMYLAAADHYQVPVERRGVPMLIVGDAALIGSLEIPEQFPAIIEKGLFAGGIEWPNIPGFREFLESEGLIDPGGSTSNAENWVESPVESTTEANTTLNMPEEFDLEGKPGQEEERTGITSDLEEVALVSENMTVAQRFAQDSVGNTLSVVVLLGMVVLVTRVGHVVTQSDAKSNPRALLDCACFSPDRHGRCPLHGLRRNHTNGCRLWTSRQL